MCTQNIPDKKIESGTPEWYEPFPEPQPFPSGWDLSEVLAVSPTVFGETVVAGSED
jgi:hypothetical protein